ncbi:MAG: D-xylose transport system substrate-binding protein [Actinomycetota bacterium]|jgi:D-xylose transport system substrate-binding protein|nr:D-xylose transport system substrate-binding protein [Actinomycetota bacterium]MDQ1496117.1 D-xylose transport system substrate-binding protein [Actinomycetota bacterium]
MNKTAIRLIAVAAIAGLGIAGCSSKKKAATAPTSAATSAAASATSAATSAAASATASGAAGGTVGVILPDTQSSTRWETADRPALTKAFADAGITADIQNALGDKAKFQSIAQGMIQAKVKVLIITDIDPSTSIQVESDAGAAGIKVIDYDRLVLGGSAAYYASYDGVQVGVEQGQCLADALKDKPGAGVIFIDGSPTDNNATLFGQGAHSVLDKAPIKKISEQAIPGWDNAQAGKTFTQLLTANGNKLDGAYVMNDGMAQSVITVLKAQGLNGKVPVTGQDATKEGLTSILQGDQTCTIYKDAAAEAGAAAKLAVAIIKGTDAGATQTSHDPKGNRDVPSVLLKPELITKANVGRPIETGAVKYADVCTGAIVALCTAAGIKAS